MTAKTESRRFSVYDTEIVKSLIVTCGSHPRTGCGDHNTTWRKSDADYNVVGSLPSHLPFYEYVGGNVAAGCIRSLYDLLPEMRDQQEKLKLAIGEKVAYARSTKSSSKFW